MSKTLYTCNASGFEGRVFEILKAYTLNGNAVVDFAPPEPKEGQSWSNWHRYEGYNVDLFQPVTPRTALAAKVRPGVAVLGTDLLDLTTNAIDLGENLTGVEIVKAWPCFEEDAGVWLEGANEDKHYAFCVTGELTDYRIALIDN